MGIEVYIKTSNNKLNTKAVALGTIVNTISDKDRDAFKLSDYNLKKAVGKAFGQEPADAYLRSPTPWGDLYATYKWTQVQKTLKPISAKILGIKSEPVIFGKEEFKNKSKADVTYSASINQHVSNTVSSSWNKGHEISFDQTISYKLDFIFAGAEGETSFSYKHSWGEEHTKSKEMLLGTDLGMKIVLKPGQSAKAVLSATQGTMDVEVKYQITLNGLVAVNYPDTYKGHHFHGLDINKVMKAGGLTSTIYATEVLKIGFYTEGKITVYDNKSSSTLAVSKATIK